MPVRYISTQLNGPWFDSRWSLRLMGPDERSTTAAALALRWMVADHRSTTAAALAPYFPGIQCNKEVQVEGIAYSFCGLWISSVLACLCVTSQLNSTAPGSIPGVGYANNPKRLLMAMVPRRPTTSTSPTRPRRPMMPGSQQRQGGQPGALGPGLPALRILPWFDLRCWLRLRPTMPRGY